MVPISPHKSVVWIIETCTSFKNAKNAQRMLPGRSCDGFATSTTFAWRFKCNVKLMCVAESVSLWHSGSQNQSHVVTIFSHKNRWRCGRALHIDDLLSEMVQSATTKERDENPNLKFLRKEKEPLKFSGCCSKWQNNATCLSGTQKSNPPVSFLQHGFISLPS